ncbi:MAG TPA: alpha/beta hydrolase [Pseudolabrys sp.]|nr:alpha/beta hydrolase [Pseudolabrys sp.]
MRDATNDFDFLVLPGFGNSGVEHWQSYWCNAFRNSSRILQDDWDNPKLADWLARLDAAIAAGTRPAVLICHSLSCSLAAHWAARGQPGRVKAALLVAPSDLERPGAPPPTRNFLPVPRLRFPVPTLVVASTDDVYVSTTRAREFAENWGADYCELPELGHINTASRLGYWPQGLLLLGQLLARIPR